MSRLSALLPAHPQITAITTITAGFSNDTYLLEGPDLILRLPPAAGSMLLGHDVLGQARIYQALGDLPGAPPVPRVVLICDDPAEIGTPFFVMERVPGESVSDVSPQPWFCDAPDETRAQICHDWIAVIASLSNLPPLEVMGEAVSPEDDMRLWQQFARNAKSAALDAAFERLLARPAPVSGPPAIIHGDTKLSNLMWHQGRISAVLDWEMALNGEPLANLGYLLFLFDNGFHPAGRPCKLAGMMNRDEVIALWEQVSGRSAQGIVWHEIAQFAKVTAIMSEGAAMYQSGRSTDPKLAPTIPIVANYLDILGAMLDAHGF